ncbi:hypothetical protein [Aliarcobacter skirrowii]|uniref:Lipoprotein n=1 Tax=Aliarcobacter skirrowii TaxID=28200 RepID=A0AAW9DBZ2_9BACT|nr:hypothetical protein [Aliarcobacter skirrowii]MDX4069759.1 hypothetical protein [Aliarcobacter skirrowii]
MKKSKKSNSYLSLIITGLITTVFSTCSAYVLFKYQSNYEYKNQAYKLFLEKIDLNNSPIMNKILNLGSLADFVATDGEIQDLENGMYELLNSHSRNEIYLMLNNEFNILRLYGDKKTKRYCEDILLLLNDQAHIINWGNYEPSINLYYKQLESTRGGISMGYEQMISDDERINLILISKLFKVLLNHINKNELDF